MTRQVDLKRTQDNSLISSRPSKHFPGKNKNEGVFKVIALMPVWNSDKWLSKALNALTGCVDGVIALDDGSEDDSFGALQASEIVLEIIKKPKKQLIEWNDAQNRFELYSAAAKYAPEWVLCIDADEILDPIFSIFKNDLLNVPNKTQAFAFHVDDFDGKVITRERYGHRMYRYRKNCLFDNKRLHCRLIPLDITLDEVRLVNVRILHFADRQTQKQRYQKYLAADIGFIYQSSYNHLLKPFCKKKIYSLGGELNLSSVKEDGLQRNILLRKVNTFDKYYDDSVKLQMLVNSVYAEQHQLLDVIHYLRNVKLDAFIIHITRNHSIIARYSFNAEADVAVTKIEAWLIEEMHTHRDFFITFSKYLLIKKKYTLIESKASFAKIVDSLIAKNILKI